MSIQVCKQENYSEACDDLYAELSVVIRYNIQENMKNLDDFETMNVVVTCLSKLIACSTSKTPISSENLLQMIDLYVMQFKEDSDD